jgi:hypothetical protein
MRRMWLSLGLVAAVATLIVSVVLVGEQSRAPHLAGNAGMMTGSGTGWGAAGSGMMGGSAMMGATGTGGMMGTVWLSGNGIPVASMAAARQRATTAATSTGLHPGEVIWFDNGFYVELKDVAGEAATEVIVDPSTGAVGTEPGPAMMWNARYGAHGPTGGATGSPAITPARAQQIAAAWLAANRPGRIAAPPDIYPGYYTLETTTGGKVNGMLSVNATTGQVWYHFWHGRFIAKDDS